MPSLIRTASLATVAMFIGSGPAFADSTKDCSDAAYEGQRLRDEGKLFDARTPLRQCASSTCPRMIISDCAQWLAEVEARIPSIVLDARDEGGHDVVDATVSIDGQLQPDALNGRAIPLEIGRHKLRFEAATYGAVEETVIVREGEKSRVIRVTMRPSHGSPPESLTARAPVWPFVIAGSVGVIGLSTFAIFGAWGQTEKDHLSETCALSRSCASDDVTSAKTKLIVADVALGVGVAAIVTGVVLFIQRMNATDRLPPRNARGLAPP